MRAHLCKCSLERFLSLEKLATGTVLLLHSEIPGSVEASLGAAGARGRLPRFGGILPPLLIRYRGSDPVPIPCHF